MNPKERLRSAFRGALVITGQLNLATPAGREAFEELRFYDRDGTEKLSNTRRYRTRGHRPGHACAGVAGGRALAASARHWVVNSSMNADAVASCSAWRVASSALIIAIASV